MNKLLLNNDDFINNLVVEEDTDLEIRLNNIEKEINLIVEENVCLNIIEIDNGSSNNINIKLLDNARVIYNKFGIDCSDKIEINLFGVNSNIELNNNIVNINDLECYEKIVHNNKSTISEINNKGINFSKDNLNICVDVIIKKDTDDSNSNQKNKVININGGKSFVLPNLIVDNKNCFAQHSCYIGDFDKESLFYLKSRGINEEDSKRLLINGLLFEKFNVSEEIKNEILKLFNEWR